MVNAPVWSEGGLSWETFTTQCDTVYDILVEEIAQLDGDYVPNTLPDLRKAKGTRTKRMAAAADAYDTITDLKNLSARLRNPVTSPSATPSVAPSRSVLGVSLPRWGRGAARPSGVQLEEPP